MLTLRTSQVVVFCTLAVVGAILFTVIASTDIYWFYPALFYGTFVFIAWQRYFSAGREVSEALASKGEYETVYANEVDLTGVNFRHAELANTDLKNATLNKADLTEADLTEADLTGAQLQGAYLNRTLLQGAYLRAADLRGAYLQDAYLQGADLQGADLQGADLQGADLQGADLQGADLREVGLRGARVTDEQLADTWSLQRATMPDGSEHP